MCFQEHEGAPHLFVVQFQTDEPASVAESEKLLRPGHRQIVAGLRPTYEASDLVGKTFALLANLKPSNFKGVRSEGMLLTAVKGKTVGLLTVDEAAHKVAPGAVCVPRDCVPAFKPNYDVKKESVNAHAAWMGGWSGARWGCDKSSVVALGRVFSLLLLLFSRRCCMSLFPQAEEAGSDDPRRQRRRLLR